MSESLIAPHGGPLVDLMVDDARAASLKAQSREWSSIDLGPRQICDLELLMVGGFSPLRGFMGQADYNAVLTNMRLADGTLWPIPITLDVTDAVARGLEPGEPLALRDPEGVMLAVLYVEEVWPKNRGAEADALYGTRSPKHPAVAALLDSSARHAVSGRAMR